MYALIVASFGIFFGLYFIAMVIARQREPRRGVKSDCVTLALDSRACVRHRESDGSLVLELEKLGAESLEGHPGHKIQIEGRASLAALADLLRTALEKPQDVPRIIDDEQSTEGAAS